MKITIWSDFVCPFCIIGQSHLDKALEKFAHRDEVDIEYKSFLLMPEASYIPGKSYAETFSELKGMPQEQAEAMFQQVTDMAAQAGVLIDYDQAKISSTVDAHRAFQYAKEQGKGTEFFKRLYQAHFSEGVVLSDKEALVALATDVGLDAEEVARLLEGTDYHNQVERDIAEARTVGVQGVPFFVFNNKYAVSGAQPVESFEQMLDKVWEEK